MPLFLALLIVPLIEIALFIQVGSVIGLWWTLSLVVLTAVAGTLLLRSQGARVLGELRGALESLHDPSEPLAHGAMILFSGALLLTPGFFTDVFGLSLMIPSVRSAVFRYLRSRVNVSVRTSHGGPSAHHGRRGETIDGTAEELRPEATGHGTELAPDRRRNPDSPWTDDGTPPGRR